MIRVAKGPAGLKTSTMTPDQDLDFDGRRAILSRGNLWFRFRLTGGGSGSAEADSVSLKGVMTVTDGTHIRTMKGVYGTAC